MGLVQTLIFHDKAYFKNLTSQTRHQKISTEQSLFWAMKRDVHDISNQDEDFTRNKSKPVFNFLENLGDVLSHRALILNFAVLKSFKIH